MSDTNTTTTEGEAQAPAFELPQTLFIPISKVKINGKMQTLEVDYQNISDQMMILVMQEGFKTLLNAKMSKLSTAKLEGEPLAKMQAEVMAQAEKNLEAIMAGSYVKGRPGANTAEDGSKVPAPIVAEARRLARNDVKKAMKDARMKIAHVKASEITAAANDLIKADPTYYATAKANLEARALTPIAKDIAGLIKVSPELVKKAEDEKAARKAQLSAKQAGKVQTRVPPAKGSVSAAAIAQAQGRVAQAQTPVTTH